MNMLPPRFDLLRLDGQLAEADPVGQAAEPVLVERAGDGRFGGQRAALPLGQPLGVAAGKIQSFCFFWTSTASRSRSAISAAVERLSPATNSSQPGPPAGPTRRQPRPGFSRGAATSWLRTFALQRHGSFESPGIVPHGRVFAGCSCCCSGRRGRRASSIFGDDLGDCGPSLSGPSGCRLAGCWRSTGRGAASLAGGKPSAQVVKLVQPDVLRRRSTWRSRPPWRGPSCPPPTTGPAPWSWASSRSTSPASR